MSSSPYAPASGQFQPPRKPRQVLSLTIADHVKVDVKLYISPKALSLTTALLGGGGGGVWYFLQR